ncbi:hypothetical protein RBWH47_01625 [Rhodopirellula baltica WH47]|uniref:Uncharacterized protein n=1 Tax=Rhodopirellula baltica WH47 TaxID=991778 RepID=F2AW52_RHOBT|nr:hypothetical protein RBWH47_01625 [Rhodopirellula baltica WH47]
MTPAISSSFHYAPFCVHIRICTWLRMQESRVWASPAHDVAYHSVLKFTRAA